MSNALGYIIMNRLMFTYGFNEGMYYRYEQSTKNIYAHVYGMFTLFIERNFLLYNYGKTFF